MSSQETFQRTRLCLFTPGTSLIVERIHTLPGGKPGATARVTHEMPSLPHVLRGDLTGLEGTWGGGGCSSWQREGSTGAGLTRAEDRGSKGLSAQGWPHTVEANNYSQQRPECQKSERTRPKSHSQ